MIKPNWDIFKAKFSENPQNNFEWFCYMLFCKEFKKERGIFRYKNQSAIETNTIKEGKETIGWQAKFYNASLSKTTCKKDVITALENVKRDYPNITKFIFYTNQEWGQNKGKEPQGKQDIEKKANSLGIKFEWRVASFFESPFVAVDNEIIAKHFFSSDESIFDLLTKQEKHNDYILDNIQNKIIFKDKEIKIDRLKVLQKLEELNKKQAIVISGEGGSGKSVLLKKFYERKKNKVPFYLFRVYDLKVNKVDQIFENFSFQEFIHTHQEETEKYIAIDSAEKLGDLENQEVVKNFLKELANNNWKLIFTARDRYINDLLPNFFEIYQVPFLDYPLKNLSNNEINLLSENYDFQIPKDEKLLDLIKNPFYLNEYLKFYKKDEQINYVDFKNKLWDKIIIKSKPAREQCFLSLTSQRANSGQFFIKPNCESGILDELKRDGILGYESPYGYFITHDIYEEWALEKNVEAEFGKNTDAKIFFDNIGNSLPYRRAFRKWLSEKLLLEDENIKDFIKESIKDDNIKSFWKDEVLISVLLSNYSCVFFEFFKDELLLSPQKIVNYDNSSKLIQSLTVDYKYEESLLHRIFFLLRIACKEVDDNFFKQLGVKDLNILSLKYVFTRPKGQGWDCLIKFIFENYDKIGSRNIHFILPIIHDWTSKFKKGKTTKYSGLIALKYYQWTIKEDVFISNDDTKNNLLQTIMYSSLEIKSELEKIFKEIIKSKWKNHRDPYYDLCKIILTKLDGVSIVNISPKYVMKIADIFWSHTPKEDRFYTRSGIEIEEHFNLEDNHSAYFPPSAYQTPIYWLLQTSLKETVDFILYFTNKSIEYFSKTEFAKYEARKIEVFINEKQTIQQYMSRGGRFWNIYRGTSVAPHVLQAMHMALEKFFLERAKDADSEILEKWLLYLLKNSKSVSMSAVVVSIVLAYPNKTFNIAKILFRTKEFYSLDQGRSVLELSAKNHYSIGAGLNYQNKIHEEERIKTCDDKHRNHTLERLALNYQLFRSSGISKEEAKKIQKNIWKIFDEYYKKLPNKSKESEHDKTWRLCLARMDRRKMKINTEEKDGQTLIKFEPEIEPNLKEWSEKSLKKNSESMKYSELRLWANYRMNKDENYKKYQKYEKNPLLALKEAKEIIKKLKKTKKPEQYKIKHSREDSFYLFNNSVPADTCSVLLRDYFDKLSEPDKKFCKDNVIECAELASKFSYQYQITDGSKSAIIVLPKILEKFPAEKNKIKKILLFILFNTYPIDMAGTRFNVYAIKVIYELWTDNFDDANSLLLGYLLIKPKYIDLREKVRQENNKKGIYGFDEGGIEKRFFKETKKDLQNILNNKISLKDLNDIKKIKPYILETAFQLIPLKITNEEHEKIANSIISIFAQQLLSHKREDRIEYESRHHFLERLSYLVLNAPKEKIPIYLKPFLDKFNASEAVAGLFQEFVLAVDRLGYYNNFWHVWNLFYNKIIELCKKGDGHWYVDKIITSYLFAETQWKEDAKNWHVLKKEDSKFFEKVSKDLGHCPSTLYSISKFLNDIGSELLDNGIGWLSEMLNNNRNLWNTKLEVNTVFYVESLIKKFIYKNREKIKKNKALKQKVLIILDFLVKKGSVVGYMLRENIL